MLFQNILILRRTRVTGFADIIKIEPMFITKTFKDSKKAKRIRISILKFVLYLYFLIQEKLLISGDKMLISAEIKRCVSWFICFLNFLYVRYNCVKFQNCRLCVTDFREQAFFRPLHPWAAPKKAILHRVKSAQNKT